MVTHGPMCPCQWCAQRAGNSLAQAQANQQLPQNYQNHQIDSGIAMQLQTQQELQGQLEQYINGALASCLPPGVSVNPQAGQITCAHLAMTEDLERDALVCVTCRETMVSCEFLAALGYRKRAEQPKYDARASQLADECGRLRDENTQLLAENARLRRGKR